VKLRHQMILMIAGPTLAVYAAILGFAGFALSEQSMREAERATLRLAESYAARFDGCLREAARVAEMTSQTMEFAPRLADEELYRQLENGVARLPLIYGACVAFEPGTRTPQGLFAPYVCRNGDNGFRRVNIDETVYDWYADPNYTWFIEPKRLAAAVWSAPYFDEGAGNILMSTYSVPFYVNGAFGGICTVDIDLPRLRGAVGQEIHENLDFVLLSSDGRYIFHPLPNRIMARTVVEYARQDGMDGVAAIAGRMLSGKTGSAWIDGWDSPEPVGVFYAPVRSTGWVFACRVPTEEVLQGVRHRMILGSAALVATLLLIGGCIYFAAGRIAAPISNLQQKVMQVSRGNLEARVEPRAASVEIRTLARSFNQMTTDLRANVERLAVEKAARKRIERDLDIAREIQQGLLPTSRPDLPGYQIAGWSKPADKTGGDYYDWHVLPNGRLFVSLADVSGHGVGPALVTAVCRAYARASFAMMHDIDVLMNRLNDLLVADLPRGRFVTFAGMVVDTATHRVRLISAGHGPIFHCRAARGELVEIEADGMPLGVLPDAQYTAGTDLELAPGDSLLLLTDGLFEWANASGELYGLKRLRASILGRAHATPDELIRGLHDDVRAFVGDTRQEDDITMVVLRRTPTP
jgi:sigma-B regulation protein RsbU (phosphoserine phosphatase)